MQEPVRVNEELSVAGQIVEQDIAELAEKGYATIINNRPDDEEPGQLTAAQAKSTAEQRGLAYIYQPVTTSSITKQDVIAFHNAVQRAQKPVLAHCRSGTRCYLLYSLGKAMFEHESPLQLVAKAAQQGYDLRVLPPLVEKLEAEK